MEIRLISPIYINVDEGNGEPYETDNQFEHLDDIKNVVEDSILYDFGDKGLIEYADSELVKQFVKSAFVTIRPASNYKLESVCTCTIEGIDQNHKNFQRLIQDLKDEIEGQYSDGWGEGFEQKAIRVNHYGERYELYVSFWNHNDWEFKTEMSLQTSQLGGKYGLFDRTLSSKETYSYA